MTNSAAGWTGRRRWEERSRPPSHYLLGKGPAMVDFRHTVVIRGSIRPTKKWLYKFCKFHLTVDVWQNIIILSLVP